MRTFRVTFRAYELKLDKLLDIERLMPVDTRTEVIQHADDAADALTMAQANQDALHHRRLYQGLICPGEMRFENIDRVFWDEATQNYHVAGIE